MIMFLLKFRRRLMLHRRDYHTEIENCRSCRCTYLDNLAKPTQRASESRYVMEQPVMLSMVMIKCHLRLIMQATHGV